MKNSLQWRLLSGLWLCVGFLLLATASADVQQERQPRLLLEEATKKELIDGDLRSAIEIYQRILNLKDAPRAVVAKTLLHLGQCHEKLGNAEARKAYERLVREFADQPEEAKLARARLGALSGHDGAMRVRQVWGGADVDLLGAPTRDGRYLTFQDRSEDLAIRDLVTGQKRRLTDKGPRSLEFSMLSVPSPDGKQVAYAWYNKDNFADLRVVGLDGSNPRVLYANPELSELEPFDWSPDGKSILAVSYRKGQSSEITLISAMDGGSVHVLKSFDKGAPKRIRFSPDGRYIAYDFPQRPRSNEYDIFVLSVEGRQETPVVQHAANDVVFDWTPDGKRILFGSDRSGSLGAWWIQVAGGQPNGTPELVKPDLGQDVKPMGFTRDGSYYYGVRTGMSDVYIAGLDFPTGRVVTAPVMATQRFVGTNSRPDWSSDGRRLLFVSQRSPGGWWGTKAICVRDVESGEVRELPSKLSRVIWARWWPDGRSLFAVASVDNDFPVCRIDIQTGDFERVDLQRPLGFPPVWPRDGETIFYHQGNPATKALSIVARNSKTGQEKELYSVTDPSFYCAGVALSPDGQQLAFGVREAESQSKVLKVLRIDGGEARDLLRRVQLPWPGSIAWSQDGFNLLFTREPGPGNSKTELWLIPVRGGEPRKLGLTARNMRELSIHPDGRRIAYTSGGDRSEIWVMENFLPGTE